ncbi:MAG: hypothetical protein PHF67_03855 [Candidatus Nanoarchaeia archaeon]|nr:hypothetical protein [Candidatus Nanoarchaeia archaeon]
MADCLHIDANCPYVVEEARLHAIGGMVDIKSWPDYMRKAEITIVDTTEVVPGESHQDACDMPCCESRLKFQIWDPNTYRNLVGIHPNARDPRYFVRNALHRHGTKSNMSLEEAEAFFERVKEVAESVKERGVHAQIIAVSDYMHKHENHLGSRPLSEAVNPVFLWGIFHPLAAPKWWKDNCYWIKYDSADTGAEVWMYDERLFDREKIDGQDFKSLNPEGIIPCVDSKGVFRRVERAHGNASEGFNLRGILKPIEDRVFLLKGPTHFLDIREVSYHAHEHYWGESGIGFSDTLEFPHEE